MQKANTKIKTDWLIFYLFFFFNIRNIREEVERERRGQEIQLRELRALADNAPLPTPSNNAIPHSGSLTKLNSYQTNSRPNAKR